MGGFLPDSGQLVRHAAPAGPGVRVDAGVDEGSVITVHYDPMISKVVCWGRTRDEAIRRMLRALSEYRIAGVETTIPFCRFVLEHPSFVDGSFTTHFVNDHFSPSLLESEGSDRDFAAAVGAALVQRTNGKADPADVTHSGTGWTDWVLRRRRHDRRR